jgi:hypothetical protein
MNNDDKITQLLRGRIKYDHVELHPQQPHILSIATCHILRPVTTDNKQQ